jgi:hypothetical protein
MGTNTKPNAAFRRRRRSELSTDGVLSGSATGSDTTVYTTRFFSLGRTDNTLNYFDGALADVRVYDYALSASEVAAVAADK